MPRYLDQGLDEFQCMYFQPSRILLLWGDHQTSAARMSTFICMWGWLSFRLFDNWRWWLELLFGYFAWYRRLFHIGIKQLQSFSLSDAVFIAKVSFAEWTHWSIFYCIDGGDLRWIYNYAPCGCYNSEMRRFLCSCFFQFWVCFSCTIEQNCFNGSISWNTTKYAWNNNLSEDIDDHDRNQKEDWKNRPFFWKFQIKFLMLNCHAWWWLNLFQYIIHLSMSITFSFKV